MGLPKLDSPIFEIQIPSTKQTVTYTPFTVKEEKILLIAQESKDPGQMILAIKQILNNCLHDVDVDKLAIFDLEYLLINLRAQSVNNVMSFTIEDPDTKEEIELEIDINDIDVQFDENHTNKIQLNDHTVLLMKYPSTEQLKEIMELAENSNTEKMFDLMVSCFDVLGLGEDTYKFSEYTKAEIMEFAESMSSKSIQEVRKFFDTMPALHYEKKYKNSKGEEKTFVVKGTETFFI